jgi:tetratricopeptide (TPR) repeat protein
MADSPRLEELRRRVQADPASIAFAALAEEYRRAGKFREAVEASRAGLRYHPTYVSARVTLGRSLVELQEVEQAERELAFVLKSAPDNLAARRALGELCWQQLRFGDALQHFRTAHTLAPADTELPTILQSLERELAAERNGANGKASKEPYAAAVEEPVAAPPVIAAVVEVEAAPPAAEGTAEALEAEAVHGTLPPQHSDARAEAVVEVVQFEAPIEARVESALEATAYFDASEGPDAAAGEAAAPASLPAQADARAEAPVEAMQFRAPVEARVESALEDTAHFDVVEAVADFEPVEAIAFVDDHADHFEHVAAQDVTAFVDDHAPTLVDEAFQIVEEQHALVVDDPIDQTIVVDEPPKVVDEPAVAVPTAAVPAAAVPVAAAAIAPAVIAPAPRPPNPALERLERFHRAILAARRRAQAQQAQHS